MHIRKNLIVSFATAAWLVASLGCSSGAAKPKALPARLEKPSHACKVFIAYRKALVINLNGTFNDAIELPKFLSTVRDEVPRALQKQVDAAYDYSSTLNRLSTDPKSLGKFQKSAKAKTAQFAILEVLVAFHKACGSVPGDVA